MSMATPEFSQADSRRNRPDRKVLSRLETGPLIRESRRLAGLSQSQLAARLGTTQSAVSNWERGREVPRVDTLGRILQACGFEADLTFRRHDDVDRTQVLGLLATTPDERIEQLENITDLLGLARPA